MNALLINSPTHPPTLPFRHVILDEADEMLKMGFAEDIEKIFSYFDVSEAQVGQPTHPPAHPPTRLKYFPTSTFPRPR